MRDYGTTPLIWDGDKGCEHEWTTKERRLHGGTVTTSTVGSVLNDSAKTDWVTKESFCSKCGAWRGSLGLEPTFELYIKHLCDIFDEVKRVLRKDGTCWVNLGDTYNSHSTGKGNVGGIEKKSRLMRDIQAGNNRKIDLPDKTLCLIPQRFAIEMVNRGWILRNTIIWHKPNCMPSSAKDRFTVDFEYLYFFTKSNKTQFWTNSKTGDCVRKQPLGIKGIEGKDWKWREVGNNYSTSNTKINEEIAEKLSSPRARKYREVKRKKISLWAGHDYWFEQQLEKYAPASDVRYRQKLRAGKTYNSKQPYKENLPYHSIKRRSDDKDGLCIGGNNQGRNKRAVWTITTHPFPEAHFAVFPEALIETPIKAGCPKGGVVLDPFMGSGTTARVALKQGKRYLGIDLKQEYIDMANKGIKKVEPVLF